MEPFTIHCDTCASRLKVRSPSAIGQRLACPKCGSMIQVVAPEVKDPDAVKSSELATGSVGTSQPDSSEFDFEDVDQVLASSSESLAEKSTRSSRLPHGDDGRSAASARGAGKTKNELEGQTPILPNEQWTAQSTQRKRRRIFWFASIAGLFILAITLILALTANRKRGVLQETSKNEPIVGGPAGAGSTVRDSHADPLNAAALDISNQPKVSGDPGEKVLETANSTEKDLTASQSEENSATAVDAENVQQQAPAPSPIDPNASGQPTETQDTPLVSVPDAPTNLSPFGAGFDNLSTKPSQEPDSVSTAAEQLTEVLEDSGTSVFEINQIAALSERRRVGLRKYFVKRPAPIDPRDFKRLDSPVAGIQYSGQSFLQMLAEVIQITGVPISLDADNLQINGFEFGLGIDDLKMTDCDFPAVIKASIAKQPRQGDTAKFVLLHDKQSPALITTDHRNTIATRTFSVPSSVGVPGASKFADLVKSMVEPDSWEVGQHSMGVNGDQLTASHNPVVLHRIGQFIEKWNIAVEIQQGNSDPSALRSLWLASAKARSTECSINSRFDVPISLFFSELGTQTGVNILIDWDVLMSEGWNPGAKIPGELDEPTVGDVLEELTHSMDVAYRVINESTFEITSPQVADESRLLEFHICTKVLAGRLNGEQMVNLVRQSLQSANPNLGQSRIYFDATTQCLIAIAPQSIHRQIDAILTRLEQLE